MSVASFLHWFEGTAPGAFLRSADPLLMQGLQLVHVFGLLTLLASAVLLALRLYGLLLATVPLPRLVQTLRPFLITGAVLAVLSGLVMFLSVPSLYNGNPAFWPKISLLVAAIAVQAALFGGLGRELSPLLARSGAALAVLLWFGVGAAGRAIAYVS